MFFGTKVDRRQSFRLLDAYLDAGGRWLDTANNYAAWLEGATGDESELLLGEWLASRALPDDLLVATKVGARPAPDAGSSGRRLGLSAPAVREQVEGSLRRLGVERVGLLYAHIDDRSVPLAETLGAFDELVREGLVGSVACSNYTKDRLAEALSTSRREGLATYQVTQMRASFLTPALGADFGVQEPLDDELLAFAEANSVRVTAYSALLTGAYSRLDRPVPSQYDHDRTRRQLDALAAVAQQSGATVNQVVLSWLGGHGIVPVLGVSRDDQLSEALTSPVLDQDTLAKLDDARGPYVASNRPA